MHSYDHDHPLRSLNPSPTLFSVSNDYVDLSQADRGYITVDDLSIDFPAGIINHSFHTIVSPSNWSAQSPLDEAHQFLLKLSLLPRLLEIVQTTEFMYNITRLAKINVLQHVSHLNLHILHHLPHVLHM